MELVNRQSEQKYLDVTEIMKLLPHRYPMLMVDRLCEIVPSESALGIKNVSMNEPFFGGHFPGKPIMPGVLIIEAMAQTAGALVVYSLEDGAKDKIVYFMSIEEAKFRKPVVPGDRLEMRVTKQRSRGSVWKFAGVATVDNVVVAEATFTAMITSA